MFARAVLEAAAIKARKFGITTDTKGFEPLQGSRLHSQINEFPKSREELIATAITDWKGLSNVRSIKPDGGVKAELLFESGEEVEKAENPMAFNKHEEARKYLAEKADWRRIVFVSPYSKNRTLWIVHQEEKPEKAFFTISNFIAEAEGVAYQGEEWALSLTNESTFEPMELSSGARAEESEITRSLQAVVAIKDLKRDIEPEGEEWRLVRKGPFKRLREDNDEINEDLQFDKMPWRLRQTWDDWASLKNEGIEEKWKAVDETKIIGSGFWASLAIEKVRKNITRAKADYERPNFEDKDWLTDLMEAGMEALQSMTARISSRELSPEKMAEKIEKAKDIFPALADRCNAQNGWITLKENQSTEWANKRPKNQQTGICDVLGDWQEQDEQAQAWTPLTRLLSTILLDLTYRQLRTQIRKSLTTKCESIGMQWNVNQGRLTDRTFIQKWVRKTIEKCQEPTATTKIEIVGEGQEHKIIWIPGKQDSQIWVFNLGEKPKKRHKMQLTRMAMHLRIHGDEAEALEKLANSEWKQNDVKKCLETFRASRNHVENDVIMIKRSAPAPAIRTLSQTIEAMTIEAKRQAPGSNSKLESVLVNLTGGWCWAAGGQMNFIQQPVDFQQTWMANRYKLVAPPRPCKRRRAGNNLLEVGIASDEWAKRAIEVNSRMTEALVHPGARYAEDEVRIEDFDSEEEAWKASISLTGGDISQIEAIREAISKIKKPVKKRDRLEDLTSRGLIIYAVRERPNLEKLQATLCGKQQQNDFVEEIMGRINKEQPENWIELAELLEGDKPQERGLTILMPQQEHADKLAEALLQVGACTIQLVTLDRSRCKENKTQPWLWKCFSNTGSPDRPESNYTPSWAHPKAVEKMAKTLERLSKEEVWTGNERQAARGVKTWEDLASIEGAELVPDAACTFYLREVHLDGIKAAQHLLELPATAEDFFPPQSKTVGKYAERERGQSGATISAERGARKRRRQGSAANNQAGQNQRKRPIRNELRKLESEKRL
ncbi:unnamed protein product [Oikopleura dioica]|uniref:Uncharacterized protein n=1 Tax=Oikopleura dioica TaxID=34765 RepID=E4XMC2_OIKDI|nr:unnamed protein product [Oikopleura dioica]